jgi:hypothetical protein
MRNKYIQDISESGDYYAATAELWEAYRHSVDTDWILAEQLEEGQNEDFFHITGEDMVDISLQ